MTHTGPQNPFDPFVSGSARPAPDPTPWNAPQPGAAPWDVPRPDAAGPDVQWGVGTPGHAPQQAWATTATSEQRPVDGMAVAGLATALVLPPVPVAPIALSIAGLVRTGGGRKAGQGLAVAGLAVSVVLHVLFILLGAPLLIAREEFVVGLVKGMAGETAPESGDTQAADPLPVAPPSPAGSDPAVPDTPPPSAPAPDTTEIIDVQDIEVGDCLDEFDEGTILEVGLIPCDQPHAFEVYLAEDLPAGPYPGLDEVETQSVEVCEPAFYDLLDRVTVDPSSLDFTTLYPEEDGWQDGDREVLCLLYDYDDGVLDAPLGNLTT